MSHNRDKYSYNVIELPCTTPILGGGGAQICKNLLYSIRTTCVKARLTTWNRLKMKVGDILLWETRHMLLNKSNLRPKCIVIQISIFIKLYNAKSFLV